MFPIRDHNPSGRTPYVTYALILANIVVFLSTWHLSQNPRALLTFYADYALVPAFLSQGFGGQGLVTSMFLHGGLAHLAGNMLFLFIFGDNIEDEMGHFGFALFYLAAGVGAGLIHVASDPFSRIPTVGASGAIAGVMGGYLLLYPKARIDILLFLVVIIRIFPVPAWLMLAVWFGMQLFGSVGSETQAGGVAYWAHTGGFVIGTILTLPIFIRLGGPGFWAKHHGHPPHPDTQYQLSRTSIPRVRKK